MTSQDLKKAIPQCDDFQKLPVQSGQKEVYLARYLGNPVAVKVFLGHSTDEKRFVREVNAIQKLASPHIPKLHLYGKADFAGSERCYLIEDFIKGESYRSILQRTPVQPLAEVLRIGVALLEACVEFEAGRCIHRDIKPDNMIIDPDGLLWVIDFGLAKNLDMSNVTPMGWMHGTPGYAPLEQLGSLPCEPGPQADLFAIGTTLYEALSGANPWISGCGDLAAITKRINIGLPSMQISGDPDGEIMGFLEWLTGAMPSSRPRSAALALAEIQKIMSKYKINQK